MTSLTVGWSNSAASVSTANKLYSIAGVASAAYPFTRSDLGVGVTGYGEVVPQGTTAAWAAAGSLPAPSGKGFLWDVTTLEGQTIAAGNWTPTIRLSTIVSGDILTTDIIVRASKRSSSGVYTTIMTSTLTAQTLTVSSTTFTLPATSGSATDFATGDKLYIDAFCNVTVNSNGTHDVNIQISRLSNDTTGLTFDPNGQVVTPGYAATGSGVTTTTYAFIDALVLSDSGGIFRWPVDSLTVSDSLLITGSDYIPLEALVADDSAFLATDTDLPIDATSISDVGGNLQRWPVDALSASDSLLGVDGALPVESLPVADSVIGTDTGLKIDALTISDLGGNLLRWPIDALTATDGLTGIDNAVLLEGLSGAEVDLAVDSYGALDTLAANDSASSMVSAPAGGVTTTTYSFTEALVASSGFLCVDGASALEGNQGSSSLGSAQGSAYTESLNASDSLLKLDGYVPFDALTISDMGSVGRWPVDGLVVTAALLTTESYVPADVQSVLESLQATDGAGWVDLLAVSDTSSMVSAAAAALLYLSATCTTRDMQATAKTRDMQATASARDERATAKTRG